MNDNLIAETTLEFSRIYRWCNSSASLCFCRGAFRDLLDEDLPATLRLYRKPPPEPHHELILEEDYDTLEWRGSWVDDMDNWDDRTFICETELLDLLGMEIEDFEEPQTFYMTVEQ